MLRRVILALAFCLAWSSGAHAAGTTWDAANCSAADLLSLVNTKVTNDNSSTGGCRSTVAKTAGKIYWECIVEFAGVSGCGAGNGSASLGPIASTANMALCLETASTLYINGSSQGAGTCSNMSSGGIRRIAVDFSAAKIWVGDTVNATTWNGKSDGTQNPNDGSGGYDISALTPGGGIYIYTELQSATSEKATIIPGPTFTGAVPTGYTSFDLGSGGATAGGLLLLGFGAN